MADLLHQTNVCSLIGMTYRSISPRNLSEFTGLRRGYRPVRDVGFQMAYLDVTAMFPVNETPGFFPFMKKNKKNTFWKCLRAGVLLVVFSFLCVLQ